MKLSTKHINGTFYDIRTEGTWIECFDAYHDQEAMEYATARYSSPVTLVRVNRDNTVKEASLGLTSPAKG